MVQAGRKIFHSIKRGVILTFYTFRCNKKPKIFNSLHIDQVCTIAVQHILKSSVMVLTKLNRFLINEREKNIFLFKGNAPPSSSLSPILNYHLLYLEKVPVARW